MESNSTTVSKPNGAHPAAANAATAGRAGNAPITHRKFDAAFKIALVRRWKAGENYGALSREFNLGNSSISAWAGLMKEGRLKAPKADVAKATKAASKPKAKAPAVEAAVKRGPNKVTTQVQDAIVFLKKARDTMEREIREGRSGLNDPVYKYALYALDALEGKG